MPVDQELKDRGVHHRHTTAWLRCDPQRDVVEFASGQRVDPGLVLGSDRFDRQLQLIRPPRRPGLDHIHDHDPVGSIPVEGDLSPWGRWPEQGIPVVGQSSVVPTPASTAIRGDASNPPFPGL